MELTPKLQLTLSARIDSWRNYDAHNFETAIATGAPTANNRALPDKSDNAVSPRAAVLYRASDRVSVWGSFSKGFRAPTLNELYRQFRVGAVLTLANEGWPGTADSSRRRASLYRSSHHSRNRVQQPRRGSIANVDQRAQRFVSAGTSAARTSVGSRPTCRIASTATGASPAPTFDIAKVRAARTSPA
jgi:outer membrane receptor protein involved in Fe transport